MTQFFLSLPNIGTAVPRVAERVRQGGHIIPEPVVRKSFAAELKNLERVYRSSVDSWAVFDNAGETPIATEWSERR